MTFQPMIKIDYNYVNPTESVSDSYRFLLTALLIKKLSNIILTF